MTYSHEVEHMCCVAKGPNHGPAPIPEEGKWIQAKEIKDISGLTHGIGWCAPQQGACKLTLNIKEGVMIEIPAAALQADKLAAECDFFSLGTNDLVQYTFAVDRGNESVAHLYQPLHPVTLKLIDHVVQAARRNDVPVCVCGEMASDPLAAIILVGMGIRRLSMSANLIPRIKELICRVAYFDMQRLVDSLRREEPITAAEVAERSRAIIRRYAADVLNA